MLGVRWESLNNGIDNTFFIIVLILLPSVATYWRTPSIAGVTILTEIISISVKDVMGMTIFLGMAGIYDNGRNFRNRSWCEILESCNHGGCALLRDIIYLLLSSSFD